MGCCGFFWKKLIPLFIIMLAILIGYILTTPVPFGTTFWGIFKIMGLFKPEHVTEPTDLTPKARPANEIFFELPSGNRMPGVGLGLCCRPAAYDDESVRRMVLHFLLEGGRTLDTAHLYLNHRGVAQGIKDAVSAGIPREEIFVTTKIFPDWYGKKTENWTAIILEELELDYVDLVLLHAPNLFGLYPFWAKSAMDCDKPEDCSKMTWEILSKEVKKGTIRDIGVSNFKIEDLKEISKVEGAPIAVNQVQFNPWATREQREVVKYCVDNNIVPTGYSSLGGIFNKEKVFAKDTVAKIAEKYGKTVSQVLLRWSLQKHVSVIPGTKSPKHMRENLDVYSFTLSDDDMKTIDSLDPDTSIFMELN